MQNCSGGSRVSGFGKGPHSLHSPPLPNLSLSVYFSQKFLGYFARLSVIFFFNDTVGYNWSLKDVKYDQVERNYICSTWIGQI